MDADLIGSLGQRAQLETAQQNAAREGPRDAYRIVTVEGGLPVRRA